MDKNLKLASAIMGTLVSLFLFLTIIDSPLPAVARFALAVAVLVGCGLLLMKLYKFEGWWGLILFKSQWGLGTLDRVAKKNPQLWQDFADLGLVLAYGSLAYFLMAREKRVSLKRMVALFGTGGLLLVLFTSIVAPLASTALYSMLTGGDEFAAAGSKLSTDITSVSFARYALIAVLGIGGIASLVTLNVLIYAGVMLSAVVDAFTGTSMRILTATPGGVPIIPGKNLPFFEGIAALAVVLAVHESLHGIVARVHKLPLKSAGLVLFGFLPFGAFVDIDEKKLFKEKAAKQNAVFVAGTAANFATSIVFLVLLLGFISATEQFRVSGIFVTSGSLPADAQITAVNGAPIGGSLNVLLSPNTNYSITTSKGVFERTTDQNGSIGIFYSKADASGAGGQLRYADNFRWMGGIFGFLALTFALNFVVGAINLIPLPLFDGYHIMRNGVKNKMVSDAITYTVLAGFVLTMVPWLLR